MTDEKVEKDPIHEAIDGAEDFRAKAVAHQKAEQKWVENYEKAPWAKGVAIGSTGDGTEIRLVLLDLDGQPSLKLKLSLEEAKAFTESLVGVVSMCHDKVEGEKRIIIPH